MQGRETFRERLKAETLLLKQWFDEHCFTENIYEGGFELECWLLDRKLAPAPVNLAYLDALNCQSVVPEVGASTIEINTDHYHLEGKFLTKMQDNIVHFWQLCEQQAQQTQLEVIQIGMLPSGTEWDFSIENLTHLPRYQTLDHSLTAMRGDSPINVAISGNDELALTTNSLSINSATSSFQIHMRVGLAESVRYYNASQIIAAPLLAISGNATYLFGKALWQETRIPLFEQVMTLPQSGFCYTIFGDEYLTDSFYELFLENYHKFSSLLPQISEVAADKMPHVRLQNSTVYRWNRPVLGFDEAGQPHLRIEFRPLSSGPSITDMVANAALYYGLMYSLAMQEVPPESQLSFAKTRENFYLAAEQGCQAQLTWLNNCRLSVTELVSKELLPRAEQGLIALGFDAIDVNNYLEIIRARVMTQRTGSAWQRAFVNKHQADVVALTQGYLAQQKTHKAVHEWEI